MNERTLNSKRVFDGRLLKLDVETVEIEGGRISEREIVRHPGAVTVLVRMPDARFVFIRQYRKPIEQQLLEVVAGCLEDCEAPEACARREVREETGYDVTSIQSLGLTYPGPGYSDETLHMFFAEVGNEQASQALDEDEIIEVVYLSESAIEAMITNNEIMDAKTLAVWTLFKQKIRTR